MITGSEGADGFLSKIAFANTEETGIEAYCDDRLSRGISDYSVSRGEAWLYLFVFILLAPLSGYPKDRAPARVAEEVRQEAALPNQGPVGRPLPLAGSWNTGAWRSGYGPDYQITMIEQGHFLLPWFQLDMPGGKGVNPTYYEKALKRCAELKLPISFISTQWERLLSEDRNYLKLPAASNPNVVKADYGGERMVSPFGPVQPWTDIGKKWTTSSIFRQVQTWYPNPPRVVFVSNNEHAKLTWRDADQDRRYVASYGAKTSDEKKREAVGQGWIKRYRALQEGMRAGLLNSAWKQNSIFVGYNAFGGSAFGRWPGWRNYSLATKNHIEPWPWPLAWDGASVPFYTHDWDSSTDYTVWSPLVGAMNWVFMLDEAYRLNPNYWFELSIWDGNQPGKKSDKRAYYAKLGQTYTPARYAGMVKFGMWLLRPRVVREFRGPQQTMRETGPYFLAIVGAVDDVHQNPILKDFWRNGVLVPNRNVKHPYQDNIPPEYAGKDRWFLLDTNLDPKRPWKLTTEIPVFSITLAKGMAPNKEWLVYAYSPLANRSNVVLNIPEYGPIKVNCDPGGDYFVVKQKGRSLEQLRTHG